MCVWPSVYLLCADGKIWCPTSYKNFLSIRIRFPSITTTTQFQQIQNSFSDHWWQAFILDFLPAVKKRTNHQKKKERKKKCVYLQRRYKSFWLDIRAKRRLMVAAEERKKKRNEKKGRTVAGNSWAGARSIVVEVSLLALFPWSCGGRCHRNECVRAIPTEIAQQTYAPLSHKLLALTPILLQDVSV